MTNVYFEKTIEGIHFRRLGRYLGGTYDAVLLRDELKKRYISNTGILWFNEDGSRLSRDLSRQLHSMCYGFKAVIEDHIQRGLLKR